MPNSPINPYESPHAEPEPQPRRFKALLRASIGVDVLSVALLLVAVLATQGFFRQRFERLEIALPPATKVALGPLLPAILAVLLPVTMALRHELRSKRQKETWEKILVVILGAILGYCIIAFWLPTVVISEPLSWAS